MKIIYKSPTSKTYRGAVIVCAFAPDGPVERYVQNFSLAEKTICFAFFRGNCHKESDPLGKCSLELEGLENLSDHSKDDKDHPKHCPYIAHLMKTEPEYMFPKHNSRNQVGNIQYPIKLCKYRCGHYATGQGQHRICISGKLGLPLTRVRLSYALHTDCTCCEEPRSATQLITF